MMLTLGNGIFESVDKDSKLPRGVSAIRKLVFGERSLEDCSEGEFSSAENTDESSTVLYFRQRFRDGGKSFSRIPVVLAV